MSNEKTIIYVHETALQSWLRDLGSFCSAVGVIGVGVFLDSDAMQWAGFAMLTVMGMGRASGEYKQWKMTPQQAADAIRDKFGAVAASKGSGQ